MSSSFTKLFEFVSLIGQLKRVQRTGWVLRKVSDPESVADHMYRMAVLSFLVNPSSGINKERIVADTLTNSTPKANRVDPDETAPAGAVSSGSTLFANTSNNVTMRCIKLSLVHDMAESIVGDITPQDCIDKEDKHRREKTAMSHISSLVNEETGSELMSLWEEYEEQKTQEAQFVKDLDKFDMIFQAYEYEQLENQPGFLQEFFDSTEGKFKTDTVQQWVSELDKMRNQSMVLPKYSSPQLSRISNQSNRESATVKPFMVNNKESKE